MKYLLDSLSRGASTQHAITGPLEKFLTATNTNLKIIMIPQNEIIVRLIHLRYINPFGPTTKNMWNMSQRICKATYGKTSEIYSEL